MGCQKKLTSTLHGARNKAEVVAYWIEDHSWKWFPSGMQQSVPNGVRHRLTDMNTNGKMQLFAWNVRWQKNYGEKSDEENFCKPCRPKKFVVLVNTSYLCQHEIFMSKKLNIRIMSKRIGLVLFLIATFFFTSCSTYNRASIATSQAYVGMSQKEFLEKYGKHAKVESMQNGWTVYRMNDYDVWSGAIKDTKFFYFYNGCLNSIDGGVRVQDRHQIEVINR